MTDRMQYAIDAGARAHRAVGELDLLADKRARNVEYVCKANCANPVLVFQHPENKFSAWATKWMGRANFMKINFSFLLWNSSLKRKRAHQRAPKWKNRENRNRQMEDREKSFLNSTIACTMHGLAVWEMLHFSLCHSPPSSNFFPLKFKQLELKTTKFISIPFFSFLHCCSFWMNVFEESKALIIQYCSCT